MFDYDRVIQINQFFTEFTLMSLFSINDIKYYFEKEGLDPESFSIFEIHHTDKKIIKCFNPPTDFNIQMAKKFIHDFETKIKHKFGTVQRSYVLFYEGWYQNDCCGQLRFRLIASKKSNAFILLSPDIYYQNESFPTSLSSPTCVEVRAGSDVLLAGLDVLLSSIFTVENMETIIFKKDNIHVETLRQRLILNRLI